jgi:hypothetical protein
VADLTATKRIYPGWSSFAITPDDDADLPAITRALYVGVTGDITMRLAGDTTAVVWKAVPAGSFLPLHVRRVMEATTATDLVGIL